MLGFEAIVASLGGLTIFGLKSLPESIPQWWGIVIGGVLAIAMIATAGMIAKPGAFAVGWALQVLVALTAFFVPAMLLVALIFGAMWAYATIGGARLDAKRPTQGLSEHHPDTQTHTESE